MKNNNEQQKIIFDDNENNPDLYIDGVLLNVNFYDFQFMFQKQVSKQDGIHINNLQRVIMSPQHAKSLLIILNRNIKKYEKEFGKINIPENLFNYQEEANEVTKVIKEEVAADGKCIEK